MDDETRDVEAYIGIGSNLQIPMNQVSQAIEELAEIPKSRLLSCSSLYRSAPMGPTDQPDYMNAVVGLRTRIDPLELLETLLSIEVIHQRVRTGARWGPRTLDLDLLLYGDKQINHRKLKVPHPGLPERAFVLYPLQEICPELSIPGYGLLSDLIARCPRGELIRL